MRTSGSVVVIVNNVKDVMADTMAPRARVGKPPTISGDDRGANPARGPSPSREAS
jgi:hypothetical protein